MVVREVAYVVLNLIRRAGDVNPLIESCVFCDAFERISSAVQIRGLTFPRSPIAKCLWGFVLGRRRPRNSLRLIRRWFESVDSGSRILAGSRLRSNRDMIAFSKSRDRSSEHAQLAIAPSMRTAKRSSGKLEEHTEMSSRGGSCGGIVPGCHQEVP